MAHASFRRLLIKDPGFSGTVLPPAALGAMGGGFGGCDDLLPPPVVDAEGTLCGVVCLLVGPSGPVGLGLLGRARPATFVLGAILGGILFPLDARIG